MPLRQYQELPRIAYTRSTVGWFQGSAYLVLTGIRHFNVVCALMDLSKKFY